MPIKTIEFERRAQSIGQLYAQMRHAGYSMDDLRRVQGAYNLAGSVFAAQLRPDGKPFVCHLVGVAAILALLGASTETVVAGLLHSAYTHGDFGLGPGKPTRDRRRFIRDRVGPRIEQLLDAYSRHPWSPSTVEGWIANRSTLDADEREIVVIRLADVLEDALDYGLQLSSKQDNSNRAIRDDRLMVLADAFGQSGLGRALIGALGEDRGATELSRLRAEHIGSYVVCPLSWRERLFPQLLRFARQLRRSR